MKTGWRTKTLGELCEIELGRTPARARAAFWDEKRETDNVWLSIADLLNAKENLVTDSKEYLSDKGAAECKIVREGTLLVSFKLTLGRLAFAGRDLYTNEAIAALTILDERELSKEYLFYYLQSFDWDKACEGDVKIKGKTLNKAKLKEIPVHLPLLSAQRRIVGILDDALGCVATATARSEKNLQNAHGLLGSCRHAVFSQGGRGWLQKTVDQLSENLDSKRIPVTRSDRKSGPYPYYGASGIVDHVDEYIFDGDALLVSEDGANLLMRSTPIAFSVSGKYWVNNHAHVLRFKDITTQKFVEHYLESTQLDEFVTGMAQPKLTQAALNSIPIVIPKTVEERATIVAGLEGLLVQAQRLESIYQQKIDALDALRKSLLHAAFGGQL